MVSMGLWRYGSYFQNCSKPCHIGGKELEACPSANHISFYILYTCILYIYTYIYIFFFGISVAPVGPEQVMVQSWSCFSPDSDHPQTCFTPSLFGLRSFLNHVLIVPQSCSKHPWFWSKTVLERIQNSP